MTRLVMLGPPGAGKGTQAQRIAQHYGVPAISTGELFRAAVTDGSPLGRTVRSYMSAGRLVPDEVTNEMVRRRLAQDDASDGFILDGFPRTTDQACELDAMLDGLGHRLDVALSLRADDDEIVARLSGRRTCRTCAAAWHVEFLPTRVPDACDRCGGELYQRADDTDETIRARLRTYQAHTAPLIDFYAEDARLLTVDAVGTVDDVAKAVQHALTETFIRADLAAGPGWPWTGGAGWFHAANRLVVGG